MPHRVLISIQMCVCHFTWQAARVVCIIKHYKANIALSPHICVSMYQSEFRSGRAVCTWECRHTHSVFVRAHYWVL